jgi:UDP-galactopyranose mutase
LTKAADRHAEGSIILVGPTERGASDVVPRRSNIHLLGARPYGSLPDLMAELDVLLIPFRVNELTRAVDPIKFYEYCATGKPIAATPIDEVIAHGGLCHVAAGGLFGGAVDAALEETSSPDTARTLARQTLAMTSTWRARGESLSRFIETLPAAASSGSRVR